MSKMIQAELYKHIASVNTITNAETNAAKFKQSSTVNKAYNLLHIGLSAADCRPKLTDKSHYI